MNKELFIESIKIAVVNTVINGILNELDKPLGRKPSLDSISRSNWFKGLLLDDRENLEKIIELSVKRATFGFLCVLDNVRSIESCENKGMLELAFLKNGEKIILNSSDEEYLHDIFNREQ